MTDFAWRCLIIVVTMSSSMLCFVILRKVARIDSEVWSIRKWFDEQLDAKLLTTYRQVEALQALYSVLELGRPLPPLRRWAGSPDFLLQLAQLILKRRPECIVECSSGASTLVIARCLQMIGSGRVFSLEHDEFYAKQTIQLLCEHGVEGFATVVIAPLRETQTTEGSFLWYSQLDQLPESIDVLVIDGPPANLGTLARYPAGPFLVAKLRPGGVALLDDADRKDEREMVMRWRRQFPQLKETYVEAEKGILLLEH